MNMMYGTKPMPAQKEKEAERQQSGKLQKHTKTRVDMGQTLDVFDNIDLILKD